MDRIVEKKKEKRRQKKRNYYLFLSQQNVLNQIRLDGYYYTADSNAIISIAVLDFCLAKFDLVVIVVVIPQFTHVLLP